MIDSTAPNKRTGQDSNVNRQWRLKQRPIGIIDADTFELAEGAVPRPGEG
jgi:NADPH-dependent curcumin reductase CurA